MAITKPAPASCSLCALPVRVAVLPDSGEQAFCCGGCRNVWRILEESGQIQPDSDPRTLPIFLQAQRMGLLGSPSGAADGPADADVTPPDEAGALDDTRQCILRIDGMWCASCAWLIAQSLRQTRGVVAAEVSFASDSCRIVYKPAKVGAEELKEAVQSLGYRADQADRSAGGDAERIRRRHSEMVRVAVAFLFCAMNVMMLTPVLYIGRRQHIDPVFTHLLAWALLILSIPVVICAWPLYDRAIRAARRGAATMETLVTVGATTALVYSVVQTVRGEVNSTYFDTADMLLGLVLVGKYIESNIRASASDAITLLQGLSPKKATLLDPHTKAEAAVTVAQIGMGDLIRVRAGETIAADGLVERGAARVDESLLTGESRPAAKAVGDAVIGGSTLLDGSIDILVSRSAADGTLQRMASLVQDALHRKTRSEEIADRISRVFVPVVMVLAVAAGAWVYATSGQDAGAAVTRIVSVLVIACPCALGIATPMAIMAGVGEAARRGVLISDPQALSLSIRLRRVLFDKTGTLTEGRFRVRNVLPADADLGDAALVEQYSEHPIARAVREKAALQGARGLSADHIVDFQRIEGAGVSASLDGRRVFVGNMRCAELFGAVLTPEMERAAEEWSAAGQTVVVFGSTSHADGIVGLGDSVRAGVRELLESLRAAGVEAEIVSGDSPATVAAIAKSAGIERWQGGVLPDRKASVVAERISELGGAGVVAMVGDGVNDAPALAAADIGIAMASGTDIAGKASGVTIMSGHLERLADLISIGKATNRVIRQNLFWALVYNLAGIPLAIAGGVTPIWAAGGMLASSLIVVFNARRLSWKLQGEFDGKALKGSAG